MTYSKDKAVCNISNRSCKTKTKKIMSTLYVPKHLNQLSNA